MGFICLICKNKFTNDHRDVEDSNFNQLVVTLCGHLYHENCLHTWLATERIKQQKLTGSFSNGLCPYCQNEIHDRDNRKMYPIDDHSEALERAQYFEKFENLEIYCHQLEVNIQQLRRENEIVRGMSSPLPSSPTSPIHSLRDSVESDMDSSDMVLMKNDRVVWIKDKSNPQTGILQQLTKKSGKLVAKIKLDNKIKNAARSGGILSSFRSHDKYTISVPFEEVLPEKEYNKMAERKRARDSESPQPSPGILKETKNIFSRLFSAPSFRSSTMSLPDDLDSYHGHSAGKRRLSGILESDDDNISLAEAKNPIIREPRLLESPISEYGEVSTQSPLDSSMSSEDLMKSSARNSMLSDSIESNGSMDEQRDYVFITPCPKDQLTVSPSISQSSLRSRSPDPSRPKHVTFNDKGKPKTSFNIGDNVMWSDSSERKTKPGIVVEVNSSSEIVIEVINEQQAEQEHWVPHLIKVPESELTFANGSGSSNRPKRLHLRELRKTTCVPMSASIFPVTPTTPTPNDSMEVVSPSNVPAFSPFDVSDPQVFSYVAPLSTPNPFNSPNSLQMRIFEEEDEDIGTPEENSSVFDSTLVALFYGTNIFDSSMLQEKLTDDNLACAVKFILRENFALPLRSKGICDKNYAYKLQDLILHLCSSYIDIEELVTILFEFTFKMQPFIRYSFDMCDYLHQFFIDFTDKSKITTIQHLFYTSCRLQDNLTLKKVPTPALILQIPRSDDKLIHYEAVIPNMSLDLSHLIEESKESPKLCFCDNVATVQCAVCCKIHGNTCVLFCDSCRDILEQLHIGMDHPVIVIPVQNKQNRISTHGTPPLKLLAVICAKDDRYTTFLRNGPEEDSPWVYIKNIHNGEPKVKNLPELGMWLQELGENPDKIKTLNSIPPLLRRLLTESRIFIYHPEILSESI